MADHLIIKETACRWLSGHGARLSELGFRGRIIGGVATRGHSDNDLDILLCSVSGADLETQLGVFYDLVVPALGLTDVDETPLEAGHHDDCWFVSSVGPQGWIIEFYFEWKSI